MGCSHLDMRYRCSAINGEITRGLADHRGGEMDAKAKGAELLAVRIRIDLGPFTGGGSRVLGGALELHTRHRNADRGSA